MFCCASFSKTRLVSLSTGNIALAACAVRCATKKCFIASSADRPCAVYEASCSLNHSLRALGFVAQISVSSISNATRVHGPHVWYVLISGSMSSISVTVLML